MIYSDDNNNNGDICDVTGQNTNPEFVAFATNKTKFFMKFDILVPNHSGGGCFLKMK